MLPNDPIMLLSVINMKLRDHYPSLDLLCDDLDVEKFELCQKLKMLGYTYHPSINQFVLVSE